MPKVAVYKIDGTKKGEIDLSDKVFGVKPNQAVVHLVIKALLANKRQGTQSTLTRAEVSGGGIKPWRQKGAGRARHGSIRSPQWRKGGVVFAPKPRSYRQTVNKKVKRLAMLSALSSKVNDSNMIVVEDFNFEKPRTKDMIGVLDALKVSGKALLVLPEPNQNIELSARNLPGVKTTQTGTLNVLDIVNYESFIITEQAVKVVEEVFSK